jgi:hypothetical protein
MENLTPFEILTIGLFALLIISVWIVVQSKVENSNFDRLAMELRGKHNDRKIIFDRDGHRYSLAVEDDPTRFDSEGGHLLSLVLRCGDRKVTADATDALIHYSILAQQGAPIAQGY